MKMLPNVLLLEDNGFTVSLVKEVLSLFVNELFVTDDLYEAYGLVNNQRIDLIISDIHLSKTQTSIPFLDKLKGLSGRVVVYSSDRDMLDELVKRYEGRDWLFLDKNFSDWIEIIRELANKYEPEQIG